MYQDLLWSMDKLQDPQVNDREFRTAMTILQTWLGQIENVKVLETPTTVSAIYI